MQHTILIDDIDATQEGVETTTFSIDSRTWTIDLAPHNKNRLNEALAPFINAATIVRKTRTKKRTKPARKNVEHHHENTDF